MAIGLTPRYQDEFTLYDVTQQQFIVLACEAARRLHWEISFINEHGLIAYAQHGVFSTTTEIIITAEHHIGTIQSASIGTEMIDWGKNRKNVNKFLNCFETLKQSASAEGLETKYQELIPHFQSNEAEALHSAALAGSSSHNLFSIFIPAKGFVITPILIDLNIFIFLLMVLNGVSFWLPDNASLLAWGANFGPQTLDGEWWRLLTNMFLHVGILHLALNMYALLYVGILLEPRLGSLRFCTTYLLTGITASIASLWWHQLTISAGASGAIFGMYGVFLAMLTTDLIDKRARRTLLPSIIIFVIYNLLNGINGGIDNAAHIGGLLSGLLIGYASVPSLKKPYQPSIKYLTVGLLSLIFVGGGAFAFIRLPNDVGLYFKKIKQFTVMEHKALEVYQLSSTTPTEIILSKLSDGGIYYWKKDIALIRELNELDLPRAIEKRNELLIDYCRLRIKSYQTMYRAISENTDQYNTQIDAYNQQISIILAKLAAQVNHQKDPN